MNRRRKARFQIPAKYVLFSLSVLCVLAMFASFIFIIDDFCIKLKQTKFEMTKEIS